MLPIERCLLWFRQKYPQHSALPCFYFYRVHIFDVFFFAAGALSFRQEQYDHEICVLLSFVFRRGVNLSAAGGNFLEFRFLFRIMVISVRTFEGKTITLDVQITDTVQHVKKQIQSKEGIRADLQRLMFANEQLKNSETLSNYGVREDSVLHLVLRKYTIDY